MQAEDLFEMCTFYQYCICPFRIEIVDPRPIFLNFLHDTDRYISNFQPMLMLELKFAY